MYSYARWSNQSGDSNFNFELMTNIFYDFRNEIWYDPLAGEEVMSKLWFYDFEEIPTVDGKKWKHYPPLVQILIIGYYKGTGIPEQQTTL